MRWAFKCKLGLRQETCNEYSPDKNSRGYKEGLAGCPSCKHREPATIENVYDECSQAEAKQ